MTRKDECQYMKKAFENTPRHKVFTHNNGFVMALFYTKYHFEPYCMEFKKIENYEKALIDNFKGWHCHHRLEKDYTREELIKKNLYYNRPPEELIFLTNKDHQILHSQYNIKKGFLPAKGHHWNLPKEFSDNTSKRIKNLVWVNNGSINKRVLQNDIPNGFVLGRIKKQYTSSLKGKKWKINPDGKRCWI